jgi:myo-inositol 2-dehydrogenase / D-chiro-inositol 1-dehydrogenase
MRLAVLGTGRMASGRAALLHRHPDVEEVVLAGHDQRRTKEVAAGCGARAATLEEALGFDPDGVVVASATEHHAEQLAAAAPLGVPVLCEKPIALSVEDTGQAIDALAVAGVVVQVGFQRRFDHGFRAAREYAAAGRLGTLYSLRISARDATPAPERYIPGSGGIFRDMHVHDFDLARWITGREVATVYATGAVRGFARFARHDDVDTSAILLTMDDGMPVLVDGSRHDPLGYDVRMEVVGSDDVVAVGLDERTPLHRLGPPPAPPPASAWTSFAERFAGAFAEETDAFVALVRDGGDSPCPPESALEALRVAVACEVSRTEGRPVAPAEVG